jgi:hypothetical protein
MAEDKVTNKQLRARRIEAVYESMNDERTKAIDSRIWEILKDWDMALEPAMDDAADEAMGHFDKLIAEGYTADEVEAVMRHHNRERLTYWAYRDVRDIWTHRWLPENERKDRGSIPVQKGEQHESTIYND